MKRILQNALIGSLIGLSTSYIVTTLVLVQNPTRTIDGHELLLELILAIFLGIGCGLISLIFYMERWSMAVKLAIHYVVVLTLVLICGSIGQWYENPLKHPGEFIVFLVIQLVIYIIIFVVIYWMDYQSMKKINEKLKRR